MSIGTMDIYLLVIIVAALVVGFFWGAARSLMLLAAWLLAFVAGAYLKLRAGFLPRQGVDQLPARLRRHGGLRHHLRGLLLAAPIVIVVSTRGAQRVTRSQALDDLVGALVAMFVAILGIAGLIIVFATFYGGWRAVRRGAGRARVDGQPVPVAPRLDHRRRASRSTSSRSWARSSGRSCRRTSARSWFDPGRAARGRSPAAPGSLRGDPARAPRRRDPGGSRRRGRAGPAGPAHRARRPGGRRVGRIVETEAYAGPEDRASHARAGRTRAHRASCSGRRGMPTSTSSTACTTA